MPNTGNTQQQINYGAAANDGQGDPLRTAFIKTDDNFDNVWLAGPVGSNITIGNNTIQSNNTNGNIVLKPNGTGIIQANASIIPNADSVRDLGSSSVAWRRAYIDELLPDSLTVSGDAVIGGNLTVEGDTIQIGNITTDTLTIQLANTAANATAANGAGITVGASDNIATILYNATANRWNVSVGMSAVGNISAPYFSGNGSLLTGMYGNANVVAYGEAGWAGNIRPAANLTYNLGNSALYWNNVYGNTILGTVIRNPGSNAWSLNSVTQVLQAPSGASWSSDPSSLDEYIQSAVDGYLNFQTYDNTNNLATELHMEHGLVHINILNGVNQQWEFDDTGNLTLPGNTFAVNYANGSAVSLSGTYGNANVVANLAALASNPVSTTGNVTAGNVLAGNMYFTQDLYGKTGSFSGGATGTGSLYAGVPLFTVLGSDVVAQFSGNVDAYTQFNFQNGNSGTLASGDYVITADNGDDDTFFFNMGLGSSNHDDPDFFGDTSSPNDAYLYVVGADATGPGDTGPGNLIIGSTNGVIKMFVGNTAQANVVQTISTTGVSVMGNVTGNTGGFAIGYRDIPQVTFSANATAALTDAGKHYYSTTAGNLQLTLPDNVSVAIPTGATLTIVVNAAGNVLVGQGTGVTLYQAGSATTGNRVVGAYGLATVMKVAANTWVISGTGVY